MCVHIHIKKGFWCPQNFLKIIKHPDTKQFENGRYENSALEWWKKGPFNRLVEIEIDFKGGQVKGCEKGQGRLFSMGAKL